MRCQIVVMTKKGFFGPAQVIKGNSLGEILDMVLPTIEERIPHELEGEEFKDWTNINIQIVREKTNDL